MRFRIKVHDKYRDGDNQDSAFIEYTNNAYEITHWSNVTIEQSTELKDIFGTELFIGDEVHYDGHYFGDSWIPEGRGLIYYENGSFSISDTWAPELCYEDIFNYNIRKLGA